MRKGETTTQTLFIQIFFVALILMMIYFAVSNLQDPEGFQQDIAGYNTHLTIQLLAGLENADASQEIVYDKTSYTTLNEDVFNFVRGATQPITGGFSRKYFRAKNILVEPSSEINQIVSFTVQNNKLSITPYSFDQCVASQEKWVRVHPEASNEDINMLVDVLQSAFTSVVI